jgi:hypothetical protein
VPTITSGAGQTIVIMGVYAWKDTDNSTFNTQWGLPQLPAGSGQVCTGSANAQGCKFNNQNSIEIALDVEYAHGTAPGARILNYMSASTSFADFTVAYNRIVTEQPGSRRGRPAGAPARRASPPPRSRPTTTSSRTGTRSGSPGSPRPETTGAATAAPC